MLVAEPKSITTPPDERRQSFIQIIEQYLCPICESVLPHHCVRRHRLDPSQMLANTRTIDVYCPHCGRGFRSTFLVGERLQQCAEVTVLEGEDLAGLRQMVGRVEGVIQIERWDRPSPEEAQAQADLAELQMQISRTNAQLAGMRMEEARLARRVTSLQRKPPAPSAEAVAEQQRTIDASFDQRLAEDDSEPTREYID